MEERGGRGEQGGEQRAGVSAPNLKVAAAEQQVNLLAAVRLGIGNGRVDGGQLPVRASLHRDPESGARRA